MTNARQERKALRDKGYMTGQEWYDRMMKALKGKVVEHTTYYEDGSQLTVRYVEEEDVFKAMKRAAKL